MNNRLTQKARAAHNLQLRALRTQDTQLAAMYRDMARQLINGINFVYAMRKEQ